MQMRTRGAVRGLFIFILEALAMVLCAFIASLAFPGPLTEEGLSFLAFFYLIPVFCIIEKAHWGHVPFLGLVYGFMFYIFYNYWLSTFHPLAILIAPVLESLQYLLLFPVLKSASALFRKHSWLVEAIFYTAYLYITQQGFLGYPYGNIASALTAYKTLIQIVDITGIWGLCFLLSASQTLISRMILDRSFMKYYVPAMGVVSAYLIVLIYGAFAIWHYSSLEADRIVRIASIQHSADSWEGGDATYRRNFETLTRLTEEALEDEPDLVAWSETAFVPSVSWNLEYPITRSREELTREFVDFGLSLPVPLVTGNPEAVIADPQKPHMLEDGSLNWKKYNTVILFADGTIQDTYRKQHLVPFTEHFPYQEEFPWLYDLLLANDYNWWEEGDEAVVFSWDGYSFSTPICFEDTFGYISAGFVRSGADFLLNMTNDVWSGAVPAEVQHMQLALFRAIENRRPLLRSTNSGISTLISITGEVIEPMEPFTQSWHVYEVPVYEDAPVTFYTFAPDFFAIVFTILAAVLFAGGLWKKLVWKRI